MKENYKETHPKEFNEGFIDGEDVYNNGFSREYASHYPFKYQKDGDENKKYAYSYGFYAGYEEAEAEDYRVGNNLNQEDYEEENN